MNTSPLETKASSCNDLLIWSHTDAINTTIGFEIGR